MFASAVFASTGAAADSDHLVGALVVTFAMIALAEVVRSLRFLNIAFGLWLVGSTWLLGGGTTATRWSDVISGVVLVLFSLPRGTVRERNGRWDKLIR